MKISKPFIIQSLLLSLVSILLASSFLKTPQNSKDNINTMEKAAENGGLVLEIFGVRIEKNPLQSKLDDLQVSTWPE